ncbi:hypothetical protein [Microbacterium sp.]|uniref:hypothetical protein n=1 Tax=Microbacterium sp. TaxID=51671 RepID=UPI003F97498F
MMAGRGSKNAPRSKASAERSRLYAARTSWHEAQISRRARDNTIAGIVGGLIIVGAIVSQSVHAAVVTPEPEPTAASTPAVLENPFADLFSPAASAD